MHPNGTTPAPTASAAPSALSVCADGGVARTSAMTLGLGARAAPTFGAGVFAIVRSGDRSTLGSA